LGDGGGDARDADCASSIVRTTVIAPEMLIVLDRSGSMLTNGWSQAVSSVELVTAELDDRIDFGLLLFPDSTGYACTASTVDVPLGPQRASAIKALLDGTTPLGNTPTAAALATAHTALVAANADAGVSKAAQYAVLITDGAPNCAAGGIDQALVSASVNELAAMRREGIKTYVLGYLVSDAPSQAALDSMAVAGGTGDTHYRDIGDSDALQTELSHIAADANTCKFVLDAPATEASHILVKLDGTPLNFGASDGWQIDGDNRTITIVGQACAALKAGERELAIKVLCETVVGI
jgi:hypothetical protein